MASTFSDIVQAAENIRKTLVNAKQILDQLNTERSVFCIIVNLTDTALTFSGDDHVHGGFAATPPAVINTRSGGAFGSQKKPGALFTGTEGTVHYTANGMRAHLHWDNPWAGDNNSSLHIDGNVGPYFCWNVTGSGDQKAEMQFVLFQLPFPIIGGIREKWLQLQGLRGPLFSPVNAESPTFDGTGRSQHFQGGIVSWHPETGAHAVWGAIGERWLQMGREGGLGFPLTDETQIADGRGRFNHFRKVHVPGKPESSIYWTLQTGAHEVFGGIRAKWAEMGWEKGRLGYPLESEHDHPGGRLQRFEGGALFWNGRETVVV